MAAQGIGIYDECFSVRSWTERPLGTLPTDVIKLIKAQAQAERRAEPFSPVLRCDATVWEERTSSLQLGGQRLDFSFLSQSTGGRDERVVGTQ